MSNTLGDYGTPPDPLNVRLPDPRDARIAELEAALHRINALNDSPARFNSDIHDVLNAVIDTSDTVFSRAALSTKEDGT